MKSDGSKFRIGISGSYGGMNLGDEAILEGILGELRASIPAEITVFSKNPADTLARHKVEHAISVRSLTRKEVTPAIRELDLLILGGGGNLFRRRGRGLPARGAGRARGRRPGAGVRDQRRAARGAQLARRGARRAERGAGT